MNLSDTDNGVDLWKETAEDEAAVNFVLAENPDIVQDDVLKLAFALTPPPPTAGPPTPPASEPDRPPSSAAGGGTSENAVRSDEKKPTTTTTTASRGKGEWDEEQKTDKKSKRK